MAATPNSPATLKSPVMFIITCDPRTSRLPAEAIRIAAGVSAWQMGSIFLYLGLPVLNALDDLESFLDSDIVSEYLPGLLQDVDQLFIPTEAGECFFLSDLPINAVRADHAQLAEQMARCSRVLHF